MSKFDDIYEIAADQHGLISSAQASELGITNNELVQYAKRGSLERVAQGVYRLSRHIPSEVDPYALAVLRVGTNAFLYGESVIAMLRLAPTTPGRLYVASAKRIRRTLPEGMQVIRVQEETPHTIYEAVPSQFADDAIRACFEHLLTDRLEQAASEGHAQGYITTRKYERLMADIERSRSERAK